MLPTKTIGSNTRPWMTWPFEDLMMHVDWGGNLQTRKSTIESNTSIAVYVVVEHHG